MALDELPLTLGPRGAHRRPGQAPGLPREGPCVPTTCDMGPDNLEGAGVPSVGGWAGIRLTGVLRMLSSPHLSPLCSAWGTGRGPTWVASPWFRLGTRNYLRRCWPPPRAPRVLPLTVDRHLPTSPGLATEAGHCPH